MHVFHRAYAATDSERDETFRRRAPDDIDHRFTRIGRGGDVEENELVCLLLVVGDGAFDRIARVDKIHEIDAFDDTTVGDIKAGDDSFGEHGRNFKF